MTYRVFMLLFFILTSVSYSMAGTINSDSLRVVDFVKKKYPEDTIVKMMSNRWGTDSLEKYLVFSQEIPEEEDYVTGFSLNIISIDSNGNLIEVYQSADDHILGAGGIYPASGGIGDVFTFDVDSNGLQDLVIMEGGNWRCPVMIYDEEGDSSLLYGTCEFFCFNVWIQSTDGTISEILMACDLDDQEEWSFDVSLLLDAFYERSSKDENIVIYNSPGW